MLEKEITLGMFRNLEEQVSAMFDKDTVLSGVVRIPKWQFQEDRCLDLKIV